MTDSMISAPSGPASAPVLPQLTPRERAVLGHLARGMSNNGIACRLFLSSKTVEAHVGAIFTKLGLFPEDGENRRVLAVLMWLADADHESSGGVE